MTVLTTIRGAFDLRRPFARIGAVLSALALAACEPVGIEPRAPQTGPMIDPHSPCRWPCWCPQSAGSADLTGLRVR